MKEIEFGVGSSEIQNQKEGNECLIYILYYFKGEEGYLSLRVVLRTPNSLHRTISRVEGSPLFLSSSPPVQR